MFVDGMILSGPLRDRLSPGPLGVRKVVWDYYSPFLGQGPGTQGRHVYRATRYTDEQVEPVFEARRDEAVVSVAYANHTRVRTFPEALRFYRDGLGG
jgi:hypothetical protein